MADAVNLITPTNYHGALPGGGCWDVYQIFNVELVNAQATVDSLFNANAVGLELGQFRTFGLWIKAASAGVVNVAASLLQSWDNTAANFVVPESGGAIITVANTNAHVITVTPTPMTFFRIRLVGGAGNDASTTITAYIWMQT